MKTSTVFPMRAITLGFHDIAPEGTTAKPIAAAHTTVYTIPQREFRRHLEEVHRASGSDGAARVSRSEMSRPGRRVFLTFDDGPISAYTCAGPGLASICWPGHFFIVTDWIGQPGFLDRNQIRALHAQGHVIGSHSSSHPERMSSLPWSRLLREWSESALMLGDIVGEPVRIASVPGGYYSDDVARAAATAGIEILFTSEPTTRTVSVDGCLILGRYAIRRSTRAEVSGSIASGSCWPLNREKLLWLVKEATKGIVGPWYPSLRRRMLAEHTGAEHR